MNKKPRALITGVTGQDGAHLADSLLKKGYEVYGGFRRGAYNKTWRTDYLKITDKINLFDFQLNELQSLIDVIQRIKPDELYNLAGDSFVADSFNHPKYTLDVNVNGTINILEAVKIVSPETKMFFASSSEIFGSGNKFDLLNEETESQPINPYAISKLTADFFIKQYRDKYDLFACSGILFNHEGPLRAKQFVPRKITSNISRLKNFGGEPMELGNLNSARDWGAAVDYVEAMQLILQQGCSENFVIATGKLSTVRDLLTMSAEIAGFKPVFEGEGVNEICVDSHSGLKIAVVSKDFFRESDTPAFAGDSSKITNMTGWKPKTALLDLLDVMIGVDIKRSLEGIRD